MAGSSTEESTETEVSVSGLKALISLADTLLVNTKTTESADLITGIGHATGVLSYLLDVIGVNREHPLFEAALLEGVEMATVFAANFDLTMPGVLWVSLHEDDPSAGGAPLVPERVRALMVDLHGDGEEVNIASLQFLIPDDVDGALRYIGLWETEDGDDLIEAGELAQEVDLSNRDHISLSPGGLRVKRDG